MNLKNHWQKQLKHDLRQYYAQHARDLPWRRQISPYRVLVSEVMLQQTQVRRVEEYFRQWMKLFPSWRALAHATRRDVLQAWQGLGYNRRGLYLHECAKRVTGEYGGRLPSTRKELEALPGVGAYTAGAVRAFAFNLADAFLETNIRTVLIHHAYCDSGQEQISDKELLATLEQYLAYDKKARENPREFYYAMMDYGAYLKKEVGNLNTKSTSYTKQSRFEGSRRQLRASILRYVLEHGPVDEERIVAQSRRSVAEVQALLTELVQEGSMHKSSRGYVV